MDERDGELDRFEKVERLLDELGREMLGDGRLGADRLTLGARLGADRLTLGELKLGRLGADRLTLGALTLGRLGAERLKLGGLELGARLMLRFWLGATVPRVEGALRVSSRDGGTLRDCGGAVARTSPRDSTVGRVGCDTVGREVLVRGSVVERLIVDLELESMRAFKGSGAALRVVRGEGRSTVPREAGACVCGRTVLREAGACTCGRSTVARGELGRCTCGDCTCGRCTVARSGRSTTADRGD